MTATANELAEQGLAHALAGRLPEAADSFRAALALEPDHPKASALLGPALTGQGRFKEALAHTDHVLAHAPTPEAWITRGDALQALGHHAAALESYDAATKWDRRRVEALAKVAVQQVFLRRYDAALASHDAAVALKPDSAELVWDRALTRLLVGDFAGGWADYAARWRRPRFVAQNGGAVGVISTYLATGLRPEDLDGRRVLIVAEQGIGDEVMFASLLPDLRARAAEITCVCDRRLQRLFSASFPDIRFLGSNDAQVSRSEIDLVVDFGELARLFRSRREAFPGRAYLEAPTDCRSRWADRLPTVPGGLRIGLSWRGGVGGMAHRSLSLDQLAPILALPNCAFVSLQYGDVTDEVRGANARLGCDIQVFPKADIDDFADLAALVSGLDLVVSVQTALVHLCGAIGAPCLAMLPSIPEWRYLAEGAAMPWYGTVRLIRQSRPGDWSPVLDDVVADVRQRLNFAQANP